MHLSLLIFEGIRISPHLCCNTEITRGPQTAVERAVGLLVTLAAWIVVSRTNGSGCQRLNEVFANVTNTSICDDRLSPIFLVLSRFTTVALDFLSANLNLEYLLFLFWRPTKQQDDIFSRLCNFCSWVAFPSSFSFVLPPANL